MKVYTSALSQTNIQADMNSTTPSVPGTCAINYVFNQGTANAHNETMTSMQNQVGSGVNYQATLQFFYLQSAIGNWTTDRTATNVIVNGVGYYATLNDAFYCINIGAHTGAISINIVGDTTESAYTSLLGSNANGLSSYSSITITPTGARRLPVHLIQLNWVARRMLPSTDSIPAVTVLNLLALTQS
ncbi:hypothetical protein [Flavobacterium sp. 3HN19-14]|uniref:hypothetical protein n=1 Tax=Flavobacterium sp. 3HN19-14 TaxID=3448133 RepID=UPI003EE382BF